MGSAFRRRLLLESVLAGLLFLPSLSWEQVSQSRNRSLIREAIDESNVTRLNGNRHQLARPEFDRGTAPASLPMDRMLLVLRRSPEQERALTNLLDEQQDKSSLNYHKWLTPEEFGQRFGPSDQDIQAVTSWLQSHGFQVAKVAKGRTVIEFSGTAAQVQETFHTPIHKYLVKGEEHWANVNDPQIPTALTAVVAGVHTLHNFYKKPQLVTSGQKIKVAYTPGTPPKVTFPPQNGQPAVHALGPADYATIYNIGPVHSGGINGGTITIAVVARSNLYMGGEDIGDFKRVFGVCCSGVPTIIVDGPDPGNLGGGEEIEATLDATWSSVLASSANVDFVLSASTNTTDGVDLSELYIIDNNLADVMTESFGDCEQHFTSTQLTTIGSLSEQAAAEGITYLVASGDSGSAGCDEPSIETVATQPLGINALASAPFTVAVGGTIFNEHGSDGTYWSATNAQGTGESAKSYIPENAWNESCTVAQCGTNANIFASGGGASTFFAKPSWQSGVPGIPADGFRDIPDVALTAAGHDFYLLCVEGSCVPDAQGFITLFGVAGTSASAPSFASIMALVNQKTGSRQGQANYVLYRLAASQNSQCDASNVSTAPASSCVFNDVTMGNNAVPGQAAYGTPSQKYLAGVGYDLASGLGSVNVANLVNSWNARAATTTTLTLNSGQAVSLPHGSPVPVSVTVTPQSGPGTPGGDVVLLNSATFGNQSVTEFALSNGSINSSTPLLPGGNYSVTAHYGGDWNFASSDSVSVPVAITPEPSSTTLTAQTLDPSFNFQTFTSGPYGSFLYLRADVVGNSKQGTATGSVNFLDGANSIGVFLLNSQGNTATPNYLNSPIGGPPSGFFTLTVGSHSLTANYFGDNSFNSSVSPPLSLSITPAATTISVTSAGAPQGATLMATVGTNSGGNAPSGAVTFSINGTQVGSPVSISGSLPATINPKTGALVGVEGMASFTDVGLANGQYTLSATYSGDTSYTGSSSAAAPITVKPDFVFSANSTAIAIASRGGSGGMTLTITANDGFTGTVQFSCAHLPTESTCNFSPASIAGGGMTTLTVSTTAPHQAATPHTFPEWIASSVFGLSGIFLIGVEDQRRRRTKLSTVLLAFALVLASAGCGGSGGNTAPPRTDPGTSAGNYHITVTAVSGSLSHSVSFTLFVP